jgi:Cyclin, N-terminal domain
MPSSSLKGCPSVVDRSLTTTLSIDSYDTASRKDGIPCCQELQHRYHGTSLLFTVSKLLKLKTSTYATSCTIFHRYCHQVSLREMNVWSVALASTVLATKIEEEYRPVQQIILMYARIYRRRRLILSENTVMICRDSNVSASKLASQLSFTEKEALLRQISSLSPLGPVYDEWYKEFVRQILDSRLASA